MNNIKNNHSSWIVKEEFTGQTLASFLKNQLLIPWSQAKKIVSSGKIFLQSKDEETVCIDPQYRIDFSQIIVYKPNSKRVLSKQEEQLLSCIVYEDSQVVVLNKPAGIMSVPFEQGDTNTAMDLIRAIWKLQKKRSSLPLHIVHRIDKETSGLLVFAKTKLAERFLQGLLRKHEMDRIYLCLAHGRVTSRTIETYLIADRGDGLRGSLPPYKKIQEGKKAITHVTAQTYFSCGVTLCEVRLETGRTHQIRIHLSEKGHPLLGEPVYNRDYKQTLLIVPRLMLHAYTLGFIHPVTGEKLHFTAPIPDEFQSQIERLDAISKRL